MATFFEFWQQISKSARIAFSPKLAISDAAELFRAADVALSNQKEQIDLLNARIDELHDKLGYARDTLDKFSKATHNDYVRCFVTELLPIIQLDLNTWEARVANLKKKHKGN